MARNERDVNNTKEGLAAFLSSPVVDSIRAVTDSEFKVNIVAPTRYTGQLGTYDKNTNQINIADDLDLSTSRNDYNSAALTLFHEALHEKFQKNIENPTLDPDYNAMYQEIRQAASEIPLRDIQKKSRVTLAVDQKWYEETPMSRLPVHDQVEEKMYNEYMSYIGEFAFHNLRRFNGNRGMALHSASLIEGRYPGAVAMTNYVFNRLNNMAR